MQPKVSVIIPNYNYARYLPQRIESVLGQTFRDFEVIILDDCSTDGSLEVIESYRKKDDRIVRVEVGKENSGCPFVQWERGLSLARGKYAWIAEADDVADPCFLEKTVNAMESDADVTVVKTMSYLIDSEGNPSTHQPFEDFQADGSTYIYKGEDYLRTRQIWWNHCYNASMMLLRLDAWRTMPDKIYSRLRYAGDWLFWGQLMNGHKLAEVREHLNSFRLHGKSVTDESRKTYRLRAESEIVSYRFRQMLPGLSPGMNIVHKYQIYKKFIADKRHDYTADFAAVDPDFLKNIGVTRMSYPLLWLYKHSIWLVEKRLVKAEAAALKPVEVIAPEEPAKVG